MTDWRAFQILDDAGRQLIAIASVTIVHNQTRPHFQLFGKLEPRLILDCTSRGISVLDLQSQHHELEQVRQEIPSLDELIRPFLK